MSGSPVSEKNKSQAEDDPSMEEILASIRKIITDDDKPAEQAEETESSEEEEVLELTDEVDEVSNTKDTEMNENTNEPASQDDVDALFDAPASQNDVDALFDTPAVESEAEVEAEAEPVEEAMPEEIAEAMETISEPPVEKVDSRSEAVMGEISEMEERLLSDATAAATLSSLSGLSSQVMMGGSNQTLEAIVKSVLKPLLRDWLNEHLPVIVEKLVRAEIDKITN